MARVLTPLLVLVVASLLLLVILELMREVLILRREVEVLTAKIGTPDGPTIGQVIELDWTLPLPEDWFVMVFVSRDCPACQTLIDLLAAIQGLEVAHQRLVLVDPIATPGGAGERSMARVTAPELFQAFGVTATPTMVLLERPAGKWEVADVAIGADEEWLSSRLLSHTSGTDAEVLKSGGRF